jgi:hypothetical protein
MRYKAGDRVKVVSVRPFHMFGPLRRFGAPRQGFPRGQARGSGTIIALIEPSTSHGITNAGGYRVQLDDGTFHYYAEDDLQPVVRES